MSNANGEQVQALDVATLVARVLDFPVPSSMEQLKAYQEQHEDTVETLREVTKLLLGLLARLDRS